MTARWGAEEAPPVTSFSRDGELVTEAQQNKELDLETRLLSVEPPEDDQVPFGLGGSEGPVGG